MKPALYWMKTPFVGFVCLMLRPGFAFAQLPTVQAETHGAPPAGSASGAVVAKTVTANVNVPDAMLLNAGQDQNNWLLHGRSYDNQRYSPLGQIKQANVKRPVPASKLFFGKLSPASWKSTIRAIGVERLSLTKLG